MLAFSIVVSDAFNDQINAEIYSAYLYLSMSTYCASSGLPGAAHWLRAQWEEELGHGTKLIDYVNDRGGTVVLRVVDQPPSQFGSLSNLFEQVLAHEEEVTRSIYRVYGQAAANQDYAAQTLLHWYIDEQVEEEKAATEIVSMLKLAGDSAQAVLMVDRQLAQRPKS